MPEFWRTSLFYTSVEVVLNIFEVMLACGSMLIDFNHFFVAFEREFFKDLQKVLNFQNADVMKFGIALSLFTHLITGILSEFV